MNILSLFDGLSGGRLTLDKLHIPVDKYYASEINPHSIKIAMKNYPDIIQLGDVTKLTDEFILSLDIDLLIFGSPCEDLSITKSKTREGLDGAKSILFWEAVKIKNLLNPKWFLWRTLQVCQMKVKIL